MSTYRKMRRQARLARRSGLQPMMVINAGEPFPETLGVLLARWAWRYRSELAPLGVTAGLVAAAWWLHHTRPHWWPFLAVLTGVATWAVALFGARWRFPTLARAHLRRRHYLCRRNLAFRRNRRRPVRAAIAGIAGNRRGLSCRCHGGRIGAGARKSRWNANCKPGPISPRPSG